MDTIDRRNALKSILGGAAAIGLGVALRPSVAEAAPIALEKDLAAKVDRPVEQAQWGPGPGPGWGGPGWGGPPPRRRRRWVCWWHRGRRVCGWRYW